MSHVFLLDFLIHMYDFIFLKLVYVYAVCISCILPPHIKPDLSADDFFFHYQGKKAKLFPFTLLSDQL